MGVDLPGIMSGIKYRKEAEETVAKWKKEGKTCIYAAVDIGGTNTRIALGLSAKEKVVYCTFECSSIPKLMECLNEVSKHLNETLGQPIKASTIAAAGPSKRNKQVTVTNYDGKSLEDKVLLLSKLPPCLFPSGKTTIINDLEAGCFGILSIDQTKEITKYFENKTPTIKAECDKDSLLDDHNSLVLAVGTGLGVGSIIFVGKYDVLPMEGGHIQIVPYSCDHPEYEKEQKMLGYLSKKLYDGKHQIEYEDICSGRGLVSVYEYLCTLNKDAPKLTKPVEIHDHAKKGDKTCLEAFLIHYKYLARCTATLSVALQAHTVFWCGDNQIKNQDLLTDNLMKEIMKELRNHPKSLWVDRIRLCIQYKSLNLNIEGALNVAHRMLDK